MSWSFVNLKLVSFEVAISVLTFVQPQFSRRVSLISGILEDHHWCTKMANGVLCLALSTRDGCLYFLGGGRFHFPKLYGADGLCCQIQALSSFPSEGE